jgi:hypothetical protein
MSAGDAAGNGSDLIGRAQRLLLLSRGSRLSDLTVRAGMSKLDRLESLLWLLAPQQIAQDGMGAVFFRAVDCEGRRETLNRSH